MDNFISLLVMVANLLDSGVKGRATVSCTGYTVITTMTDEDGETFTFESPTPKWVNCIQPCNCYECNGLPLPCFGCGKDDCVCGEVEEKDDDHLYDGDEGDYEAIQRGVGKRMLGKDRW